MLINLNRWRERSRRGPCPGPDATAVSGVDRRSFLRLSLGAMTTLALPVDLALAQQETGLLVGDPSARAIILLWLEGGPSHIDTFDPKPGNGEFGAIDTRVRGVQLCEHLPRVSDQMDKIALVRSVNSAEGNHQRARYLVHTGYAPTPTLTHPSLGAIVAEQMGDADAEIPNFISLGGPSAGPGFLGVRYSPFVVQNPTQSIQNLERPDRVSEVRFDARLSLAERLDQGFRQSHPGRDVEAFEAIRERTVRFMNSRLNAAFDLESEPEAVRAAYGEDRFGQGTLMARRLVEVGVPFVEVSLGGWDTHQDNFTRVAELCGQLDAAFSTLLSDLAERDLLDQVLVVCMGEFGRTPRINANDGRDHWPQAWSAAFAGGGVRGGQVIGATDEEGAEIVDGQVGVPDLAASICHGVGIDHTRWMPTPVGRPIQVADGGSVIPGLFRAQG